MTTVKGQPIQDHIDWAKIELEPPHGLDPETVYVVEAFLEALTKLLAHERRTA